MPCAAAVSSQLPATRVQVTSSSENGVVKVVEVPTSIAPNFWHLAGQAVQSGSWAVVVAAIALFLAFRSSAGSLIKKHMEMMDVVQESLKYNGDAIEAMRQNDDKTASAIQEMARFIPEMKRQNELTTQAINELAKTVHDLNDTRKIRRW